MSEDHGLVKTRSGIDLLHSFREVTEEIDATPALLRDLAARRRELARGILACYGWDEAVTRMGVSGQTLAELTFQPTGTGVTI